MAGIAVAISVAAIMAFALHPAFKNSAAPQPPEEPVAAKTEQKQETVATFTEVDLGLSVLWATLNLGAESPHNCGDYYARGETLCKTRYTLQNYKFAIVEDGDETADCSQVPYSKYISSDGKNGFFLPAAGVIYSQCSRAGKVGERGRYWSSSSCKEQYHNSYGLTFDRNRIKTIPCHRYLGFPIRPVRDRQ